MRELNVLLFSFFIHLQPTKAKLSCALLSACVLTFSLSAAPSGGPYGPIPQNYDYPEVEGTIYYVAPDGDEHAEGIKRDHPTTLESAIAKVVSGDAIILRGGTYRTGDLHLNQSILMQAYKDERPIIKGTKIATEWENAVPENYRNRYPSIWATKWTTLFPSAPDTWWRRTIAGQKTRLHKFNNDLLFIDGRMLQSTDWFEGLNENTYYIDYENELIYLSQNPEGKLIEITAFNEGLVITPNEVNGKKADSKGPTLRGIDFAQYAQHILDIEGYYPQGKSDESQHGKDIVGTTIEHCTFSYAGRVGIDAMGDKLTMRHCKITDTSTEGLYIVAAADVLLEKNIFTRNNIEEISGYYPAAVKIFNQTHRVVCNDNLIIDLPHSNGVWYDVGNVDGVFTNNWVQNVGSPDAVFDNGYVWPSRNGFFFEISSGATVSGNVFVDSDHAMLILNAADVHVFNNTFINALPVFARDARGDGSDHFGWHVTTGPGVDERDGHSFYNNLLVSDRDSRPLLSIWQPKVMCDRLTTPSVSKLAANAYFRLNNSKAPLLLLNQKTASSCISELHSIEELTETIPGYGNGSVLAPCGSPSPFTNPALQRYEPIEESATVFPTPLSVPEALASAAGVDAMPSEVGAYGSN